ncbi:hypothetical protein BG005_009809, partial [Podila minutissima]
TVVKAQKQGKESYKQCKNLYKELAAYQVRDWAQELKEKHGEGEGYLIKMHREDADMDYLVTVNEELVKTVAAEVSKFVEVKGGGKGRWQGKSKSWKGLETAWEAAEAVVKGASA